MVEKGIVALLLADAAVTAMVGTRVEPAGTAQTLARPNIVYQRVTTNRLYSQDGPAGSGDARVQLSIWADTYATVKDLADKVRTALEGYRGTVAGIVLDSVRLDDEDDMPLPPDAGREVGYKGVRQDYRVDFQEAIKASY